MARRIAFAAIAIPTVVFVIWLGGWPLAVLLSVASCLGAGEVAGLADRSGAPPLAGTAMLTAAVVPLLPALALANPWANAALQRWWAVGMVIWLLIVMVITLARRGPGDRPLAAIAVTAFAVAYAAGLPTILFFIRHATQPPRSWVGTALAFFPLVVVWVTDTAAMLGGMAIGGPKLAPIVSPHKTRAGSVAGVVFGALAGAGFDLAVFRPFGVDASLAGVVALAVAIAVAGQLGDLVESLLKREAGVKDSSALIPGHGGVLDRLDALYFAIPVAAVGYFLMGLM
ncbi:MAG: phosphatidate cytidylyltransferase [Gemmatimonadales bacterium]